VAVVVTGRADVDSGLDNSRFLMILCKSLHFHDIFMTLEEQ
jgi:hypothetical protein